MILGENRNIVDIIDLIPSEVAILMLRTLRCQCVLSKARTASAIASGIDRVISQPESKEFVS